MNKEYVIPPVRSIRLQTPDGPPPGRVVVLVRLIGLLLGGCVAVSTVQAQDAPAADDSIALRVHPGLLSPAAAELMAKPAPEPESVAPRDAQKAPVGQTLNQSGAANAVAGAPLGSTARTVTVVKPVINFAAPPQESAVVSVDEKSPQELVPKLERASRIERLSAILGGQVLTLPPPARAGSPFSAKLSERMGVEDAVRAAIGQSYLLAAAESRERYSEAMTGVARAALLPQVRLSMRSGREKTSPGADTYKYAAGDVTAKDGTVYHKGDRIPSSSLLNGGVKSDDPNVSSESFAYDSVTTNRRDRLFTVSQSLFDYIAWSEVSRQNRVLESAQYASAATRLKAVLDATHSYLQLFQNSLALRFAEDYEREMLVLFERMTARVAAGASSPTDLERVKGRRVNARSTVLDAKNALEVELTAFQKLTGYRPAALALPPDWLMPVPPDVESALHSATEHNPALMSDMKQAESVLAELRKVKGAFMPQIGVEYSDSLTRGTGGTHVPVVTSSGANFKADGTYDASSTIGETNHLEKRIQGLMLTLNWNLFSGGQDFYQHRAVSEKYNESMFRLLDTRRDVEEKLRANFESLASTAARVKEIAKEVEANQMVVQSYTEQMFAANRSLLDVLDAHQKVYQSRLDYTRLLIAEAGLAYDVLYNIGSLADALQVPADIQSPRETMGSLVGKDVWRNR